MSLVSLPHRLASGLFALVLLFASNAGAAGKTVAGVAFDEQIHLGPAPLLLNGAGVRSMFFIKAYTLGLYLPHGTTDAVQVIGQAGPKRIRIVGLRDVNVSMFLFGLRSGLEKNLSRAEQAALQPRLDQFNATLKAIGEIPEGASFTIDLTADDQTRISLNDKPVGQDISGADFYRALLRVWLGEKPAQEELKANLLGQ
jgi:hypothetical protein